MIEQDTIRLLRECDAGVKMGIHSINEVLDGVQSEDFKNCLIQCRNEHEALSTEIQEIGFKMKEKIRIRLQKACPG